MGEVSVKKQSVVKKLNYPDLVAGDIIVTRSTTASSAMVRGATFGQVSHVILFTSSKLQYAVDATTERGVDKELLYEKLRGVSYAMAFRHKTATPEQCARACQWAELQAQAHKPYDYKSAARLSKATRFSLVGGIAIIADELEAAQNPEGEDASFMCSELVFRAWEMAGAPLIDKPAHLLAPTMMFKTQRLAMLGRVV
jgi:uncharacterized protein YycO